MPRSPKKLSSPKSPTREKLAREAKDRPKIETPTRVLRSPKKSPTKKTPTPKKEKSSPKKSSQSESGVKPATPKKSTPSKYSHPTYEAMIRRAIKEEGSRKGTSYAAIYKFVEANFTVPANYQTHVRNNLKKLIEDETLIHGTTTHRYKLSAKAKAEDKKSTPRKKTPKKEPSSPKKERSSRSKSEDSPKKKKKSSKSEESPKKKTKKERSSSPKRSPKKETPKSSPAKSTRSSVKKETPKKTASPRGGVKKPKTEKKTPPKSPRGSTKKASPLSSPSRDDTGASSELKWTWQYYDNGFFNYHPTASDVVEGVYQEYRSSPYTTDVRSVKSGQWSYLVDFREMTQQNVEHESHTKRKIRRVQIPANQANDLKKKYADDGDGSSSD